MNNKDSERKITIATISLSFVLIILALLFIIILFKISIDAYYELANKNMNDQELGLYVLQKLLKIWVLILLILATGVALFALSIISTVIASRYKDQTPFILLIVGFFVGICRLVGLFLLLKQQSVRTEKINSNQKDVESKIEIKE